MSDAQYLLNKTAKDLDLIIYAIIERGRTRNVEKYYAMYGKTKISGHLDFQTMNQWLLGYATAKIILTTP